MKLNFKALNIAKAERQDERKFFDVFNGMSTGSMGISDLLFLYHAGGASDDDFDKDFKQGIGTMMTNILEGINEAGFLGEIDTKAMEKQLKQDSSKTSGESNKA